MHPVLCQCGLQWCLCDSYPLLRLRNREVTYSTEGLLLQIYLIIFTQYILYIERSWWQRVRWCVNVGFFKQSILLCWAELLSPFFIFHFSLSQPWYPLCPNLAIKTFQYYNKIIIIMLFCFQNSYWLETFHIISQ